MYKRASLAYFFMMIFWGILILNLGFLSLNMNTINASYITNYKSQEISTLRGEIYDRNMMKLVNNNENYITVCLPLNESYNKVKPYITDDLSNTLSENIKTNKVTLLPLPIRFNEKHIKTVKYNERYDDNQLCVHLIGHLNNDGNGALGLEKSYNKYLNMCQKNLKVKWDVDAMGHILLGNSIKIDDKDYKNKSGIQLTIDKKIQEILENALLQHNIDKGCGVILDGETSEILAMASFPKFNPNNILESLKSNDSAFLNRAISSYAIGSVYKPIVLASALEHNIKLNTYCNGQLNVNGTTFCCNNFTEHGYVNMKLALEKSCNCYFIRLGQIVGKENLLAMSSSFGFGNDFEICDNMILQKGILPKINEINSEQALANLSFGQGKLTTSPLHLALVYSVFANGGYFRPPTLMRGIIDENGEKIEGVILPEKTRIISEITANKIDEYLESVVNNGTGKNAHSNLSVNHGKTATAQSGWYDNHREILHTWFCGYFRNKGKIYTIVIFKEDGFSGATDCAPIFKTIQEKILMDI